MIGTGQHIWVRMWNGDEVIADGVLEPGADCHLVFKDGPQSVTHWSICRITKDEATELATEKGIQQDVRAVPSGWPL